MGYLRRESGNLVRAAHGDMVVVPTTPLTIEYVSLPSATKRRISDRVTVNNSGTGMVFVLCETDDTIDGVDSYSFYGRGSRMFVQTEANKWTVIGCCQEEVLPVFSRDTSDTSLISGAIKGGLSYPLAVRMNTGVLYYAVAAVTCDIDTTGVGGRVSSEAISTGLWHIYAVPSGTFGLFKLIMSKAATPLTGGPTGFSTYRYLWTIRVDSTGPAVIERFIHSDSFYYVIDKFDASNQIVTIATATPTLNTWYQINGGAMGAFGTTVDIYSLVPSGIANQVLLGIHLSTSSATNQTGHLYLAPTTVANAPAAGTTGIARSALVSTGSVAGYSASDGMVNEEILNITTDGVCISYQTFSANIVNGIGVRGYNNSLYRRS